MNSRIRNINIHEYTKCTGNCRDVDVNITQVKHKIMVWRHIKDDIFIIIKWRCSRYPNDVKYGIIDAVWKTVQYIDFHGTYELFVKILSVHYRKNVITKKTDLFNFNVSTLK